MLTVIDLFCGAGGLSYGFAKARGTKSSEQYKIAYGIDLDEDAIQSFRRSHFPGLADAELEKVAPCKDIEDVGAQHIMDAISPLGRVDVLIGGPNCQGISSAGLRNPDDRRNAMLRAFIRLVGEIKPTWFVLENVPALTHANNRRLLAEIFEELERLEDENGRRYRVGGDVLLAADYGVPQFRYRLFLIGTASDAPILFPLPTHGHPSGKRARGERPLRPYATVENAIANLADVEPRVLDPDEDPEGDVLFNHYCMRQDTANRERIAHVSPGKDWRSMPVRLLPDRYFTTRTSDQKGTYGRLVWQEPAFTITNAAGNVSAGPFIHPKYNRGLSVREAARLQSFSDEHRFFGSLVSQFRQVGNAVPPLLAEAVAETLLRCHFSPETARQYGQDGRLNSKMIREALAGKVQFPVMTPRIDSISTRRGTVGATRRGSSIPTELERHQAVDAWNAKQRPPNPFPEDEEVLRELAKQPTNYKAARRALAIVQFLDGESKATIVRTANVSETSVRKWINGYYQGGVDGWRAYNTSLGRIAGNSRQAKIDVEVAVRQVRRLRLLTEKNDDLDGETAKRLHMNSYLTNLRRCFAELSVDDLLKAFREGTGYGIGTVYVADLLAICYTMADVNSVLASRREIVDA